MGLYTTNKYTCKLTKVHFSFKVTSTPSCIRQNDVEFASVDVGILGMAVVSPDILLVSVHDLQKVQLVITRTGHVASEVELQSNPRGLCLTRGDQAVVTVVGKKVQIINVSGLTLNMGIAIDVQKEALGITKIGDASFVLSYDDSPWLEVITIEGKVVHQYDKNGTSKHFKRPDFLTTPVDGFIYVSDCGTTTITKLNSSLQQLQTFSSPLLSWPQGIIFINPGQLLVCNTNDHRIVLMNTNTGMSSILLEKQDGIKYPRSLSYCPERKMLYVAPWWTNSLKLYRLP